MEPQNPEDLPTKNTSRAPLPASARNPRRPVRQKKQGIHPPNYEMLPSNPLLELEQTQGPEDQIVFSAHQPWPERIRSPPNARRQGSVAENSQMTRYAPSDEKKDKVASGRPRTQTGGMQDTTRPGREKKLQAPKAK